MLAQWRLQKLYSLNCNAFHSTQKPKDLKVKKLIIKLNVETILMLTLQQILYQNPLFLIYLSEAYKYDKSLIWINVISIANVCGRWMRFILLMFMDSYWDITIHN